jgi:hypothetical protein
MRITPAWPVVIFVTITSEPIGSVRCAAVIASSSNTWPFAALRPLYGAVYHVASPVSLRIGVCVATKSRSAWVTPTGGVGFTELRGGAVVGAGAVGAVGCTGGGYASGGAVRAALSR